MAAARVSGLLQDPDVLTAASWQDWLHPRGKDGKFIQKNSWVNVFGLGSKSLLNDPDAPRMRAQINRLTPQGAHVTYYDAINPNPDGTPRQLTQSQLGPGYPTVIPVDQLKDKVALAPQPKALMEGLTPAHRKQVPGQSHEDEFSLGVPGEGRYVEAQSITDWTSKIHDFNQSITEDPALSKFGDQAAVVAAGQGTPISDEAFTQHEDYISAVTDKGLAADLGLDNALKDSYGLWSTEAHLLFEELVNDQFMAKTANETKPRNRRAIFLGGLPGAGKTSTLESMGKAQMIHEDDWINTNPDDFKEALLEKGLFPNISGLSAAETSSFIHEASSEMNHMLEQLLMTLGYNVVFDITMGGKPTRNDDGEAVSWVSTLVKDLKQKNGYQVDGLFVDVPTNTASVRIRDRHKAGLDALRTGRSRRDNDPAIKFGGRTVPDKVIAENTLTEDDPNASQFNSQNAVNFAAMRGSFERWALWDNSAETPQFVSGTAKNVADLANMPGYYPPMVPGEDAPPLVPGELQDTEGI